MSDTHDVSKMVAIYKKLFLILAIITVLGIGMALLNLPIWLAVVMAFGIMAAKAKVVLDSFKHLLAGRSALILVFGLTVIFFAGLVLLPFFNHHGYLLGTEDLSKAAQMLSAADQPVKAHHGH